MLITPDYHFLYVPPPLGADWLFLAARQYWDRFHPIVIDNLDLIDYAPPESAVAITILARRDFAVQVIDEIRRRFPGAYHDPLVYDVPTDLRLTLDGRVTFAQRFGVPDDPTPTPSPVSTPARENR